MIPLKNIKTCRHCEDFMIWIDDRWLCPTCDKKLIERLKYKKDYKEIRLKRLSKLEMEKNKT